MEGLLMREVYIIGIGMTRFGKYLDRGIKSLSEEAITNAFKDSGASKKDIDSAWFSNSTWGYFSGQASIRGQVALRPLGIRGIPVTNVENACAGGSTALGSAWTAIGAGVCECALAVGAEKIYNEDREKMFNAFFTFIDVEHKAELFEMLSDIRRNVNCEINVDEGQAKADREKSIFMDIYAAGALWHMSKYGSTQRQLAIISAKNHFHSSINPYAQIQKPMTVEEVLGSRLVSWPLTIPMCAPLGDGAAAAIICSKDFLKRFPNANPVKIRASALQSGGAAKDLDHSDIGARTAKKAYELSGVGPSDIDVAEVHDATAYAELHHSETLGFCAEGEGGIWAECGATKLGGKQPLNTSGGLESRGHPVGATGLAQIFELVKQLRGEAGSRQVEGARLALAQNGGGTIGCEEAAMCVHVLEKV
jgi:acetyl-CoA acetyltransferase